MCLLASFLLLLCPLSLDLLLVAAWVLSLGRTSLDLLDVSAWILSLPQTEIGEFISDGTVRGKTGQIT